MTIAARILQVFCHPSVKARTSKGQVQAVFFVEPDEEVLLAHINARYRVSTQLLIHTERT
jgi:hypothetical protein